MKKIALSLAAVSLVIGLSACSGDQQGNQENQESTESESVPHVEEPTGTNNDASQTNDQSANPDESVSSDGSTGGADSDNPAKDRPKTKTDTIELEGNKESFQFTLHDNPALQFSTYIVDDFLVEGASSGEGEALIVYANFAGNKNEDAKVFFFSPSGGTQTVEEQAEQAKEAVKSEGFEIMERTDGSPNRYALSEMEFDISKKKDSGETILGTVSVFQHGDRVYRVIVQYPEDWTEGFVPRVHKMFEDIVWYETL